MTYLVPLSTAPLRDSPFATSATASAKSTAPLTPAPALHTMGSPARWFSLLAVAALAACATVPPPTAEMAVAEAAVVNANQAGAVQWAPAELRSAQDKLVRARAAMAGKEHAQALMLAHEVNADAQVAAVAARAAKAQRAADEVQEANRVLREELARKQPKS